MTKANGLIGNFHFQKSPTLLRKESNALVISNKSTLNG